MVHVHGVRAEELSLRTVGWEEGVVAGVESEGWRRQWT